MDATKGVIHTPWHGLSLSFIPTLTQLQSRHTHAHTHTFILAVCGENPTLHVGWFEQSTEAAEGVYLGGACPQNPANSITNICPDLR